MTKDQKQITVIFVLAFTALFGSFYFESLQKQREAKAAGLPVSMEIVTIKGHRYLRYPGDGACFRGYRYQHEASCEMRDKEKMIDYGNKVIER